MSPSRWIELATNCLHQSIASERRSGDEKRQWKGIEKVHSELNNWRCLVNDRKKTFLSCFSSSECVPVIQALFFNFSHAASRRIKFRSVFTRFVWCESDAIDSFCFTSDKRVIGCIRIKKWRMWRWFCSRWHCVCRSCRQLLQVSFNQKLNVTSIQCLAYPMQTSKTSVWTTTKSSSSSRASAARIS